MAEPITPRTEPVLKIQTITNEVPIEIDGRTYGLRHPMSLSPGRWTQIVQLSVDIDALEKMKRRTNAEEQRLSDLTRELIDLILVAPDEVKAKLGDLQCSAVFQAFIGLRSDLRSAAAEAKTSRSTGSKRSRASRASTGARRKSGSGVFRSLSSSRV